MMMNTLVRAFRLCLLTLAALVFLAPMASAYTITLNGFSASNLSTVANDAVSGLVDETVNPAGLAYSYTSTSIDGLVSSESTYTLNNAGFDITFDQTRTSTFLTLGQSYGTIYFSPDVNVYYAASGSYSAVDPEGRRVVLYSRLYDETASSWLYRAEQISQTTVDESFTVGGAGGDDHNYNEGSLSGTLIAGHDYRFYYVTLIQAYPTASTSGATATGNVSLDFSAVPEPGTALLVTIGLIGLAAKRKQLN